MRKVFVMLAMFACAAMAYAQQFTAAQETLRKEISSYLSQQGLNPENQSDGLKFKSEGANFYIEIDTDMKEPMYVRLRRYIKYDDTITREVVLENLNDYNVKYGVKVNCLENSVVVSSEMFLTRSSQFTYVFSDMLTQVKKACELITE